jgi:hypothetical protein
VSFPLHRVSERVFAPDFKDEVFVCDIDRTYLATRLSSWVSLATIPLEFAIDKETIEGMVALLKEVRRGPGPKSRQTPLFFVSASPRQLRGVIERKMLIDGLEFDGTTFKDWGKVLLSLRPARLREQLGFKLTALISARQQLPAAAPEVLLGDDLESDALAFALYADYLAGRLEESEVLATLAANGVAAPDVEGIRRLRRLLGPNAGVKRAYIRLERFDRTPEKLLEYAPGVVTCRGALQIAVVLWAAKSISAAGVARVWRDLTRSGVDESSLTDRFADAVRRALVSREQAEALWQELGRAGVSARFKPRLEVDGAWAGAMERSLAEPWTPVSRGRASDAPSSSLH